MLKLSASRRAELQEFQKSLNISFKDLSLLNQAFIHSSFVNENNLSKLESNERMEYLGDSVLGLITCEYLFRKYTEYDEGSLTKIKSVLVSKPILAGESSKLNYGK
ncbi:MAG: ribonuclease III domain-containing protein, partial [Candidatus Firestonebacteria bacterium]